MKTIDLLHQNLDRLKLDYLREHYQEAASKAARNGTSHLDFFADLISGQRDRIEERSIKRRIANAQLPYIKTLDTFDWTHPQSINRPLIQDLFHLRFLAEYGNVIFVGPTGVGKTHLAIALDHHACNNGHRVFYSLASDIVNHLAAAKQTNCFAKELRKFTRPEILHIDEIGYLQIDQQGAESLFQVISQRYERTSTIVTTNRRFKEWPKIFNNDSVLASALLDRLLHRAEVVLIEGVSYNMTGESRQLDNLT